MSRVEYSQRLARVLDYFVAHLADRLNLFALAGVANFSRFHLHRAFAGHVCVGDFVKCLL